MFNRVKQSNYGMIGLIVFTILIVTGCSDNKEGYKEIDPKDIATVFLGGDYERLYDQTSKEFQKEVTIKELRSIGDEFNEDVDTYLFQAELPLGDELTRYAWTDEKEEKAVISVVDTKTNIIVGFQVIPIESYPDTDEVYTETTFQLPFEDEWFVFWGGTNELLNYHYVHESQRYAFDFLMMKDSISYEGDATKNESYYAFGKNMLAPANGVVVDVVNNIKDNDPVGEMNEENPAGNYVIIDHGNEEYSFLVHFKYESIQVKEGDEVKTGDVLGLVGNSGNSSEPHIHFHVADSPDVNNSKSIRIDFNENSELIQGDFVSRNN